MRIFVFVLVLIVSVIFALPTDILPPHPPGFFLGLGAIGFSAGWFEISTNPIADILGFYNMGGRFYLSDLTVVTLNANVFDPQLLYVYAGNPYPSQGVYIWYASGYIHNDTFFGNLVFKSHGEFADAGVYGKSDEVSGYVHAPFMRLAEQVGFFPMDFLELFGGVEMGMAVGIYTGGDLAESSENIDIEKFNEELREKTLYSIARMGFRWYYGDFVLELGYRWKLIESPLDFVQGFTFGDQVYNYYTLWKRLAKNGEEIEWNIPFITTPYYLTISAKF